MLWGRSMGAVTAILFAAKYRRVQALVLDSPFSDLTKVIQGLAATNLPMLPNFIVETIVDSIEQHTN